ncbi:MAG: hypothetical protein ACYTGR_02885 [Planctomycetota bacterium]|jgi:hypothetical protein
MLTGRCAFSSCIVSILFTLVLVGCAPRPARTELVAPHAFEQLWIVAPLLNESGISVVDTARVADMITQELQQVRGINALPVNRALMAMDQLGINTVSTEADARALMNVLDVDGLVVGTVTAYDPYPPLTLGVALQLYARTTTDEASIVDPVSITRVSQGEVALGMRRSIAPAAQASEIFSANDQQTLASLHQYADSRYVPDNAYGPDIYLVSMDLYTQFVSHRLIRSLLESEQVRLSPMVANEDTR